MTHNKQSLIRALEASIFSEPTQEQLGWNKAVDYALSLAQQLDETASAPKTTEGDGDA